MNISEAVKIYMQTIRFLDESTNDYLYIYDMVNDRVHFTDKMCEKYPIPRAGEEGVPLSVWGSIVYFKDFERLENNLNEIKAGLSENHDIEYRLIDKDGKKVWIKCRGTILKDEAARPQILMGSISELAMGRKIDNLTGLWNADKFMEDMGNVLNENSGYLMVLGIDDFKHINVKNGRTFGNYILKMITEILENTADYEMKLYRLAGDCFAVNFIGKSREDVLGFYGDIKTALRKNCTISAGVADYKCGDDMDGGAVYQYAEDALDRAKKEGKNRLVFFSSDDYQKNVDRIKLLDEIRASVQDDCRGFYICYQSQIYSGDFKLYGAEALLRYESSERGNIGPQEFIPLLEQSGLICEVGLWVLKTAVKQCMEWRKKIPDFHINVNISYVQLRQCEITEQVLKILQEVGLPGEALTLEVTESMQLQDYAYFNKIFYEWKRCGIKIAIDDFGTGYSSLSYLKSIDIDETKIDRCFITSIQQNAYNYHLLSNMIELAHSAQIRVCCEGVETEGELLALRELSPDVLQGFLFAKPYKKEEFERFYVHSNTQEYQKRIEKEENFKLLERAVRQGKEAAFECSPREVLENTNLGLWEIRMDLKTGYCEMYIDQVMRRIMGMKEMLAPKDCYDYWHGRINEGYYNYVTLAVESAVKTGKVVQVEYTWNHPDCGEVTVRCTAIRVRDKNGMICLEGYHRNISGVERPEFLPGGLQSERFEYNEKKHTIYFHTGRRLIAGEEDREEGFPRCWIEKQIVHPHFAETFKGIFQDGQSQKDSGSREILLRTKKGTYGWFKLKTGRISEKGRDVNTLAVLIEPADQERTMELEYMRKTDFYGALISETAAYAEVDVESGHIMESGGLWESYGVASRENGTDFDMTVRDQVSRVAFPEDEANYRSYLNLQYMKEMYKKGVPTQEMCFRRYVEGRVCWMKLVLHVFQDRYTENMYALLYLKDIDAEKKRELEQESAAKRDPLTGVYNRNTFKDEVEKFMAVENESAKGALIILDIDNFKQINDKFGHLKGDEMLKALTEILRHTFRSRDLIGRLGGDEFLVFVKDISDKEVLDRRMEELFHRLKDPRGTDFSCSAGISFVGNRRFSYRDALKKADRAMYKSKEKGKNCYTYYQKKEDRNE